MESIFNLLVLFFALLELLLCIGCLFFLWSSPWKGW